MCFMLVEKNIGRISVAVCPQRALLLTDLYSFRLDNERNFKQALDSYNLKYENIRYS